MLPLPKLLPLLKLLLKLLLLQELQLDECVQRARARCPRV